MDPLVDHITSASNFHIILVTRGDRIANKKACLVPLDDWEASISSGLLHFNDTAAWQSVLSDLHLSKETNYLVVDDGRMVDAAKVWLILQYFGVQAFILNALPDDAVIAELSAKQLASSTRLTLTAGSGQVGIVDKDWMQKQTRKSIVDVRTPDEFIGVDRRANRRGGHIPGAQNLPHNNLLVNGFVAKEDALRSSFEQVDRETTDVIVTHCDGGGRAALAAAAALRAGELGIVVYFNSFKEWAADEACPIA